MLSGCGDDQYFFYETCNNHHNGKDIAALHQEALINLETFLEEQLSKRDHHRPAHSNISGSQIRMHSSRIQDPTKKFNNDKGKAQLCNHTKTLTTLGKRWINNLLKEQYFIVNLLNNDMNES